MNNELYKQLLNDWHEHNEHAEKSLSIKEYLVLELNYIESEANEICFMMNNHEIN